MQQCEHGLADAKDDCIECWKARVRGLEAECDADLKANLGLNEECNRLIEESAKLRKDYRRIQDHWRDSVKECEDWSRRNIELVQENANLHKVLSCAYEALCTGDKEAELVAIQFIEKYNGQMTVKGPGSDG